MKRKIVIIGLLLVAVGIVTFAIAFSYPSMSTSEKTVSIPSGEYHYFYAGSIGGLFLMPQIHFSFHSDSLLDFLVMDSENFELFQTNQTFECIDVFIDTNGFSYTLDPQRRGVYYFLLVNEESEEASASVILKAPRCYRLFRLIIFSYPDIGITFLLLGVAIAIVGLVLKREVGEKVVIKTVPEHAYIPPSPALLVEHVAIRKCPKCGEEVGEDEMFCHSCGAKFVETPPPAIPQTCPSCGAEITPEMVYCTRCGQRIIVKRTCPSCGYDNPPDAKFCTKCGSLLEMEAKPLEKPVPTPVAPLAPQPAPIEEVSNWWYLLPLFLTLIGGIIAWAVNRNRNPRKARNFLIVGIWPFILAFIVFIISFLYRLS